MKYPLLLAAIILSCLPVFAWPLLLDAFPTELADDMRLLVKLYPVALFGYGICAWLCRRDRQYLSWILIALSLLTSAAIFLPLILK